MPPFLATVFAAIMGLKNGFTGKLLAFTIVLFFIQLLPVTDLLFRVIAPNPGEDFARNLAYAQNMIEQKTLWGGDQIAYPEEGKEFVTQPGYRYYLAFQLFCFKHLYRFIGVLNSLLFVIALFWFMKAIVVTVEQKLFRILLVCLVASTVLYATKNILMGLNEWLMILCLLLSVYYYKVKSNEILAVVFLALVVFVRQNALLSVMLMFFWMFYNSKNKILSLTFFSLTLLLPVYHNLYYAGKLQFFVSIHQWPFLKYVSTSKLTPAHAVNYMNVLNNVFHYLGFHVRNTGVIDFIEEGFFFLLAFPVIVFYIQKKFFLGLHRFYYLATVALMVGPTVFLGTHFYPRFEFVCFYFGIAAFVLFISTSKERFPLTEWRLFNKRETIP
ncbi:hypothetical protein ESA94_05475 [Lacibacter luteus]|uniref:Glycosyltransferase RgtA/B/C/D-like domain-containing protein n=1 Tax=Lacibacter luteus TaxID=2508719 RepID=A0A4Q1CN03_9BACT|nr:hypothetical protein [Lacibacter luteus]RXK62453.1 hypothetical protein ESA94_05475 [Lacibacter luteus]